MWRRVAGNVVARQDEMGCISERCWSAGVRVMAGKVCRSGSNSGTIVACCMVEVLAEGMGGRVSGYSRRSFCLSTLSLTDKARIQEISQGNYDVNIKCQRMRKNRNNI